MISFKFGLLSIEKASFPLYDQTQFGESPLGQTGQTFEGFDQKSKSENDTNIIFYTGI